VKTPDFVDFLCVQFHAASHEKDFTGPCSVMQDQVQKGENRGEKARFVMSERGKFVDGSFHWGGPDATRANVGDPLAKCRRQDKPGQVR
jgi:hypothetical protein